MAKKFRVQKKGAVGIIKDWFKAWDTGAPVNRKLTCIMHAIRIHDITHVAQDFQKIGLATSASFFFTNFNTFFKFVMLNIYYASFKIRYILI